MAWYCVYSIPVQLSIWCCRCISSTRSILVCAHSSLPVISLVRVPYPSLVYNASFSRYVCKYLCMFLLLVDHLLPGNSGVGPGTFDGGALIVLLGVSTFRGHRVCRKIKNLRRVQTVERMSFKNMRCVVQRNCPT